MDLLIIFSLLVLTISNEYLILLLPSNSKDPIAYHLMFDPIRKAQKGSLIYVNHLINISL